MNKYWAIFKINIQTSLTYRAYTLFFSIGEFIDTLVFLFIWVVIFGEKQAIGGFTLPETITYLIGIGIITNIAKSWIHSDLSSAVSKGDLSRFLTKPISYPAMRFVADLAEKPLETVIRLITYMLIAVLLQGIFIINLNMSSLIIFASTIILSYFINFLISTIIGCYSFWFTENSGLLSIYRAVATVFSGGYAPLTFFPHWFQIIGNLLPFAYTSYFPMLIYLNKLSGLEIAKGIGIQILWIILLYFVARFLWRKGIKKYEGVGI